ncbi:MAG: NADH-quinone oxidoreductase subunit M [Sulfurovum sp.]|nr:NADH-quinone oxidoreductase subunit M [Sulfurovum sp.]MCB4745002.1 NADH-quinone oxidoreductase subunit M [Sulfurovum sp.]MCB4746133.1 NADH-quinone oxidoreductase subunit M [Sulfurovum sp.]MCB4749579.1 NADH-quinone oxidoreductase subunit M [Sulfurovum sp.]MCB4750086.1 NADH-quinone oxidoreductase subunit M [Sulfurovum sp.]
MDSILSVLIFFPAIAGLLGFVVDKNSARVYGITVAIIEFLLSLWLWFSFDANDAGMQFVEMIPLIPNLGVNYYLGVDGISLFIVLMTTLMTMIGMISMTIEKNMKNMVITLLFLEMTMIGVFMALDAIIFYLFWELSLVPMFYIVGAWGGPLRIYAAIKFFLYTFMGSLIMLVGMLFVAYVYHSLTGIWSFAITDWYALVLPIDYQLWLFVAFFLGFAIKVPMFPFHTWLPYAHGQAPTIGSVILAAVLLKMGTYGFVRFSLPILPDASVMMITPIAVLSIIMIIYTAMVAYAQKDMKQVVAYSSVSHMGIIMIGIFAMNAEGIGGSIFQMLSHGIVSGALFMLVGVIYDRRHTKLMSEFGGLAAVMPKYAVIFGIMLMASVGLPLTIGFVGEFLVLLGFYQISPIMTIFAGTSIIIGSVYMLAVFKKSFFGPVTKKENQKLIDLTPKEIWSLVPLVAIVIWLGVYPKPVLDPINKSVNAMLVFMNEKAITSEAKDIIRVPKLVINAGGVK